MSIKKAFEDAFVRAKAKGWDRMYVLVDIHGTVFKPSYHNEEKYEFYDYAKAVLQMLTGRQDIKLIMWTSSTQEMIDDFLNMFEKNGIHFDFVNENPEIHALPTDPKSSDFSNKFYFNIGLDDKFGFDPTSDWKEILEFFYYKSIHEYN